LLLVVYSVFDVFDFLGKVMLVAVAVLVSHFAHEHTFHHFVDFPEASDFTGDDATFNLA